MTTKLPAAFVLILWSLCSTAAANTPDILRALVSIGCLETADGVPKLKVKTAIRCYQKAAGATPTGELSDMQMRALLNDARSGAKLDIPIRYSLPKPGSPTVLAGADFRAEHAKTLWGDVCVSDSYLGSFDGRVPIKAGSATGAVRTLKLGYRYNPLIIMSGQAARGNYDYVKNYPERFGRDVIGIARQRADWASEDRLETIARELPYFWGDQLIYFAPAAGDPYSTCSNGHINKINSQYALFLGEAGPRVFGNLCETVPTILFGPSNYKNLLLTEVFESALLKGRDISFSELSTRDFDDYADDKFLDILRKIMGLHEVQCGRPVVEMDIIFEEQIAAYHIDTDIEFRPETYMKPALRGTLVRTPDDKLVFKVREKSDTAAAAEENAARERAVRQRLAAYRAGLSERFALGALLIMGGAAYLESTVFNDCNRPQYPGDPPRPLYCKEE